MKKVSFPLRSLKSFIVTLFAIVVSIYLLYYFLNVKFYKKHQDNLFESNIIMLFENSNCNNLSKKLEEFSNKISYKIVYKIKNKKFNTNNNLAISPKNLKNFNILKVSFEGENIDFFYKSKKNLSALYLFPLFLIPIIILLSYLLIKLEKIEKDKEKRTLMLSMAKEAAHQMGTPVTSIKGWIDLLKEEPFNKNNLLSEPLEGLEYDISRIEFVLERFSKLSEHIQKNVVNLEKIIDEIIKYLSKRLPQNSNKFKIEVEYKWKGDLLLDKILISWAIENIIKNALDSIPFDKNGKVFIKIFDDKEKVFIDIIDNGSGIILTNKKKIFDAGFSTKQRGWGIGLSLVKRVIEENHRGKVYLKSSSLKKGSFFRIELKKNQYE